MKYEKDNRNKKRSEPIFVDFENVAKKKKKNLVKLVERS